MKVAIVGISLARGGAERSMAMQSRMLTEMGFEVHLIVLNDAISYEFCGRIFNLGKLKTSQENNLKRFLRIRKLKNYLKVKEIEVVIDHRPKNNFKKEIFYANYIYHGIKTIYVTHNVNQVLLNKQGTSIFFKRIHKYPELNVAVSKYIEREVLNKNGIPNTKTIHNAFDDKWKNQKFELPQLIKSKTYILAYGRIDDEHKDYKFLLNSYMESQLWKRNVFLIILGEGPDKNALMDLAKSLGLSDFIVFINYISQPFEIVKKSKYVTLTSRYEGFPMVLVESLSLGIPVISLDIKSGPNEIIKHGVNGLLVESRNEKDFAKAMIAMFDDEDLYNYCRSNSKKSIEQFSMKHISELWAQSLNSIK